MSRADRKAVAAEAARVFDKLAMTSEKLAAQVADVLRDIARFLPGRFNIFVGFGGVSINPQLMALRGGADVVVATPGRLLDLIEHKALSLARINCLVLDEADRLLDLGFSDELQGILSLLPKRRQSLFFSATFAPKVQALAQTLLTEPLRVEVAAEPARIAAIAQRAIEVDANQRTPLVRHILTNEGWTRVLVFVATRYTAEHVADKLFAAGVKSAALHGELSQGTRSKVLAALKSGDVQVLIATDVAARGLDVTELQAVINYDLPRSAQDYTHRIGRTGRAGETGVAISFISTNSTNSEAHFRLIEKRQGLRVPREQVPGFEPKELATQEAAVGGVKGKRMSKKDKLRAAAQGGG